MRGKTCVRGVVVLGVALGGFIAPASLTSDVLGVSEARAEKFYTRKRVNGQWITGLFPAEGDTAPARTRRRPRVVARARATTQRLAAQAAMATPPEGKAAEPAKTAARLDPRSVSYDFETGVKTTVFANSVVREPFDVPSVKRLAVPPR